MLRWRLLMSAILIPAIIGLFALDHRIGRSASVLLGFCVLAALRNVFELCKLLTVRNLKPHVRTCSVLALLIVFSGWLHAWIGADSAPRSVLDSLGCIAAAVSFAFLALLSLEAWRFEEPGRSMESLGTNLIVVLYGGLLLAVTAQLRWFPHQPIGYFALASMIICVKCGDTFAYTFGRLWGKRKMAPKLSPGKTWMGLVGAIVGSTLGGCLWLSFGGALFEAAPKPTSIAVMIAYSASLGAIGLVGDLCESLIKRDVGKKDAPALLPGFGGLLDLLDSPLFTGPIALAWWVLMPPAR